MSYCLRFSGILLPGVPRRGDTDVTMRDPRGSRADAAPRAGTTYRPDAGTWNTRTDPARVLAPAQRPDPFAALGHEASRHGAARHEHGPAHSLWPHADEPHQDATADDEPRSAWRPHATWRPTPSVPFPRPAPSAETDPPSW
jgi:hypothetical protein